MNKLVSRSLEILGQATKEMGQEYTSNLTSFINDAKDVRNSITKTTTDAADTFAKLKTANITKKISDWFYQEENASDASSGDEFDAGFKIDSSDDKKLDGDDTPKALTADSMTDITEKQTSTMLKIGRRQTEQTVANTAEIISVVNSRSSEMITSMNNINKSLIGISDRLDKLIKLQAIEPEEDKKEIDKGGLYSDGNLSLGRIFEAAKQSIGNNTIVSTAQMGLQYLTNGQMDPVGITKLLLGLGTGKQLDILGGRSIDEVGKRFNDIIGTATQTAMNEMINSGPFKKIFGDITSFEGDKDYGSIVPNHYDTKKAQFDGMTRMSIINVIPEMLNKINESVSGVSHHLDSRGQWVKGPQKDEFSKVAQNMFSSSGLSGAASDKISNAGVKTIGRAIPKEDIDLAGKALTAVITYQLHNEGTRSFAISHLKGDMSSYIENAVLLLCTAAGDDPSYWARVCQTIVLQLSTGLMDSSQFVSNINQSLQNTISDASQFAQSGKPNASQARRIDFKMVANEFYKANARDSQSSGSDDSSTNGQPQSQYVSSKGETDGNRVNKVDKELVDGKHTQADFIRGIFGILNRGVNVKVLSKRDSTWKFGDYDLGRVETKQELTDNKFGELFGKMMNAGDSDDKTMSSIVKEGVSEATKAFLGGENAGKLEAAGGIGGIMQGGGGFFSNMFSILGASGLQDLARRAVNGGLSEDVKGFFGKGGKGQKLIGQAREKLGGIRKKVSEAIPGSIKYDKRTSELTDAVIGEDGIVNGLTDRARSGFGRISGLLDNNQTFQNIKGTTRRIVGNHMYNDDTRTLNAARDRVSNFALTPEDVDDVDDRVGVEMALEYIKAGDFKNAKIAIECLKSKQLKEALSRHIKDLKKIDEIKQKRREGRMALANGETPDVGSVLQTTSVDTNIPENEADADSGKGSPIMKLIKKGFSLVGKWFKQAAKFTANGVLDITFGLKTLGSGLKQTFTIVGKSLSNVLKPLKEGIVKVGEKISGAFSNLKDHLGNVLNRRNNSESETGDDQEPKRSFGERLGDKIRNSGTFGASFMSGFDEAREAKKKLSEAQERASSFTNRSIGDIMDIIKGEKSIETSPFNQILDMIKGFRDDVNGNHEEDVEIQLKETKKRFDNFDIGKAEKDVDLIEDASDRLLAEQAIQSIKFGDIEDARNFVEEMSDCPLKDTLKAHIKDYDKIKELEAGGTTTVVSSENGNGGVHNIQDAVDAVRGTGSFEGGSGGMKGLVEGIGKSLGGITQILMGIGEAALGIIMGMEGFKSLMNIGTELLQDILAPINDIFVSLKKMIDSILKPLKDAMHDIVESIVGLVTSLFDALRPVIDFIKKLVDVVVNVVVKIMEKITGIISTVIEVITTLVQSIIDVILPIIDLIASTLSSLLDVLTPILDMLGTILESILEPLSIILETALNLISGVLETVLDTITSLLKDLMPAIMLISSVLSSVVTLVSSLLEIVLKTIAPILDLVGTLLGSFVSGFIDVVFKILTPFFNLFKNILMPVLQGIGHAVDIISGVLQIGSGIIIGLLGVMVKGIGMLLTSISHIPGAGAVGETGEKLQDKGDSMMSTGSQLLESGAGQLKQGVKGIIQDAISLHPAVVIANTIKDTINGDDEEKDESSDKKKSNVTLADEMGAGDVNASTINNSWTYTYGSGNTTMNQHSYGNYMNMSERGCGPVALADAYSRRNGVGVNPATLASAMMGSGSYDPARGTSVSSMVRAGSALGMGMRVGGVTQSSLNNASPTNPITLLGSGAGFGTKMGNNHYVNVIGTDHNGGAYVANPMTGRVERQSATSLTLNSKLGLYGSGDSDLSQYGFDDDTIESMNFLRDLTGKLTSIFTGDKGEDIDKALRAGEEEAQANEVKRYLEDDEYTKIVGQVRDKLKSLFPKKDGQSDEEYEAYIDKKFSKYGNRYIVELGGEAAEAKRSGIYSSIESAADETIKSHNSNVEEMKKISLAAAASTSSGASNTGAEMAPFSPIKYTEPQISGTTSSASPVHNYFEATSGAAFNDDNKMLSMPTINGGWYGKTENPNKNGVGSKGLDHEAIMLTYSGDDHPMLHAITGGTVTYVTRGGKHGLSDPNGGLGNSVKWRDAGGMYHWYLHLNNIPKDIQENANIEPNQIIGGIGNTGISGNEGTSREGKPDEKGNYPVQFLRYIVTKAGPQGSTGDEGHMNPLEYWKFEQGTTLTGDSEKEQIFNYLVNTVGLSDKGAAGIMGVFQAESSNSAATLEGNYAFDKATVSNATKSNAALNSYTTDKLFPMYARSGVSISKSGYMGADGNYYPGFGLAQWTGPRGKEIMDYAKSNGTNWEDLAAQLSFIKDELGSKFSGLMNYIKDPSTPEKAADAWMTQYEAGCSGDNPFSSWLGSEQISTRRTNAANIYSELHGKVVPATNNVDKVDRDGNKITGRFVSTVTNNTGGSSDIIKGAALAFEAYGNANSACTYDHGDHGPLKASDGYTWQHFRPDCSGFMSASLRYMGYDFKGSDNDVTGPLTYTFNENSGARGTSVIKDSSGNDASGDWSLINYSKDALQPGDWIFTAGHGSNYPVSHVGMFISQDSSGNYRGLDGGGTEPISNSYTAAKKILSGSYTGDDLRWTIQPNDSPEKILRYIGGSKSTSSTTGSTRGGFTSATNYGYTGNVYNIEGLSPAEGSSLSTSMKGAAGKTRGSGDVGDFWYDSLFNNTNGIQTDIPPIDETKLMSNGTDTGVLQQFIQKYEIKSDNTDKTELLDKMSKMTFNVRAQRVEELLEELIEKVSGDKPDTSSSTNGTDTNLFRNNGIPEPITRLSKG